MSTQYSPRNIPRGNTHLWYRIRRHEPKYVGLDPLVQLNQRLQLGRVEGARCIHLNTSLESLASKTGHHLVQVGREFVAQSMVDVQLALTRGRKVCVVDLESDLNQSFVVALHRLLPRSLGTGTG